jgi:hypothetical protein
LREAKQHFFYNTFNITHYVALNDRIVTEWWIGKDFEGNSHGLIEVLSQHLPGGTEESHINPQAG